MHDHDLSNPYNIAHFFASNAMAKTGLFCVKKSRQKPDDT